MLVRYTSGTGEITTRLSVDFPIEEAQALIHLLSEGEGWTPPEQSALERVHHAWRAEEVDALLAQERSERDAARVGE